MIWAPEVPEKKSDAELKHMVTGQECHCPFAMCRLGGLINLKLKVGRLNEAHEHFLRIRTDYVCISRSTTLRCPASQSNDCF